MNNYNKTKKEFESLAHSRVLMTGANGFLGYYMIKSLIAWNDLHKNRAIDITALSTFRSGIPEWMKILEKRPDFKILKKDITKYPIPSRTPYDYVIHAASIASPTYYRLFPVETINANVLGLYRILDYLVARKKTRKPVKGLLYFSSSEIYGNPTKGNIPTPESYNGNVSCTGPRACYDESKRFCETLCVNYANVYGLPVKSARPFNNYGPGLKIDDKRVIPDIARFILQDRDIVLYSDGGPSRTFCYIADAIAGYIKVLIRGKKAEAYNIGSEGPEITISSLAETMRGIAHKQFGYTGTIRFEKSKDENYLKDNPQRRCPVIAKARKEIGFNPKISLEEGLIRSLLWYKQQETSK